ncbi:2-phospho-L-lactate guanylyltransferase [Nocardioides currus]|uniref:2-phospho-L-lactate guanylyltransferase n=1 Tax=Nocardioides currus TaxID=2133958 RepID=A0A2R7YWH4_9ACTN|nr:2-phospho-L-lactate guanylyltransferase [Nocardioides currus]PUA80757.1 2-phospho-L-lactate guanylyltransferase [Nocardioides currus]
MTPPPPPSFVVIVPVKPPARGKSRLDAFPPDQRRDLAAAFARDTVAAARRTPGVEAVLGVTDDFRFAADLRADGCAVIPDGVSEDLNATLRQAAAEAVRRWPHALPVALCADLPSLRSDDLAAALREVSGPSFVRDAAGTGTTMYAAPLPLFDPAFGPGSAVAHAAGGAREVVAPSPTLRVDVDEPHDLEVVLGLGVGTHTARAWELHTH